jgi:hypothetical protein
MTAPHPAFRSAVVANNPASYLPIASAYRRINVML